MDKINPYHFKSPKFQELASLYPEFSKYVIKTNDSYKIDWKNSKAVKELTRTLIYHDIGLKYWDIPDGFLIPTLTSRLNYIYWINSLLELDKIKGLIKGIDIGTGANIIYPLLGHNLFNWNFLATDINKDSIAIASTIISKTSLTNNIFIFLQPNNKNIFINLPIVKSDLYSFSMSNPPFFNILTENKHDNPHTDNEYNYWEVYYEGGELNFITIMINESLKFKNNIYWFTTLVGKKSNLIQIKTILKSNKKIKRIKETTFTQGKLSRWGIAWSYYDTYKDFIFERFINQSDSKIPYIKKY